MKLICKGHKGDEILNKKLQKVEDPLRCEGALLLMGEVMCKEKGVGLAANQVGLDQQLFIMAPDGAIEYVINPEIVKESRYTKEDYEACLSYPGITAKIARPIAIIVNYHNGVEYVKERKLKDYAARVFLHEYDHLQGHCKVSDFI